MRTEHDQPDSSGKPDPSDADFGASPFENASVEQPASLTGDAEPGSAASAHRKRRGRRGGVRHRLRRERAAARSTDDTTEDESAPTAEEDTGSPQADPAATEQAQAAKPANGATPRADAAETPAREAGRGRRRLGERGTFERRETPAPPPAIAGDAARKQADAARLERLRQWAEADEAEEEAEEPEETEDEVGVPARERVSKRERRAMGPDETLDVSFMHPSEREIAKALDFYGIKYLYEPRSFPLRWEGNRVTEMFTPDFYLPAEDRYLELTTMKQSLVTQKNRKLRRLRELYPDVNVLLLYRRDIMRFLAKYGHGPMAGAKVVGGVHQLIGADEVAKRVREIGRQITKDYAGRDPVLIGVLRGAMVFLSDLIRNVDVPGVQMDFIKTSSYAGAEHKGVSLVKDVEVDLKDRHVILVEDIVDTGLTLKHLLGHLATKLAASLAVCALLDKPARRMTDVRIDYVGFQIPDEFVVGYGLDYNEQYRNLPFVGYIKPEEPKFEPQR